MIRFPFIFIFLLGLIISLASAGDFVMVGTPKGGNLPVCCQVPNLLTCQVARIDPSLLGPGTSISLPGGITVFFSNLVGNNPNAFHYSGPEADVTITCNTAMETCHGQAMLTSGEAFVLENCGSTHVWKQLDVASLGANEAVDFIGTPTSEKRSLEVSNRESLLRQGASDNTTVATYSIKFYYTPEVAAITPDLDGFFEQIITETNQGYANSEVPLIASKLCQEQISLTEYSDAFTMLHNFSYSASTPQILDSADVAMLVVKNFGSCGIAWFNTLSFPFTFSAVMKSCATGYYSSGHEIGHNIGLTHDPATSSNSAYPYGTGHLIASGSANTGYRTIMAYSASGHTARVNYYSNPNVIYPVTGTSTGAEMSNNAAVLLLNRFVLQEIGDESSTTCATASTPTTSTTTTTTSSTTTTISTTSTTSTTPTTSTTTSSGTCVHIQMIPRLARIGLHSGVRTFSDCSTLCVNTSNCEYWAFKNNRRIRRRRCFLYQIRYMAKSGYTSGHVSCNSSAA